jgi:DNA-directed RNA polymerase specialized sigma24 family protein
LLAVIGRSIGAQPARLGLYQRRGRRIIMDANYPVILWLRQLKGGDPEAARQLWDVYYGRMVELARIKLQGTARRAADEEDVALSAFKSFCRGAREGQFSQVHDGANLWPLLMALTSHKAIDLLRHERRVKRGGPGIHNSPKPGARPATLEAEWAQLIDREPSPDFALQLAEESQRLLDRLSDSILRTIAVWKMEGYTTEEIATKLGCVPRTVERKLQVIWKLWGGEGTRA